MWESREGKRVVRLKGGDPFVFGRTSSEIEALVAAGVPFEVVPGVTSAIAGPAYAGIPVTDRRFGGAVAFVTASHAGEAEPPDWRALARIPTLVVLMGAARVEHFTAALLDAGAEPDRPAAAIERATTERQRVIISTLRDLAHDARAAGIGPPTVFVIGEVAALASRYAWFVSGERSTVGRVLFAPAVDRRSSQARTSSAFPSGGNTG